MIEGKRGDLRTIWDSLDNEGKWTVFYDHIDAEVEVWLEWETEEEKEREWGNLQAIIKSFHWQRSSQKMSYDYN